MFSRQAPVLEVGALLQRLIRPCPLGRNTFKGLWCHVQIRGLRLSVRSVQLSNPEFINRPTPSLRVDRLTRTQSLSKSGIEYSTSQNFREICARPPKRSAQGVSGESNPETIPITSELPSPAQDL